MCCRLPLSVSQKNADELPTRFVWWPFDDLQNAEQHLRFVWSLQGGMTRIEHFSGFLFFVGNTIGLGRFLSEPIF